MANKVKPEVAGEKLVIEKMKREIGDREIKVFKDGKMVKTSNANFWKEKRATAKAMTDKRIDWKGIKTIVQKAKEARDKESQAFYDNRQKKADARAKALGRLGKRILSEIPKASKSTMSATVRPKSYKYLSDAQKRLIDMEAQSV